MAPIETASEPASSEVDVFGLFDVFGQCLPAAAYEAVYPRRARDGFTFGNYVSNSNKGALFKPYNLVETARHAG